MVCKNKKTHFHPYTASKIGVGSLSRSIRYQALLRCITYAAFAHIYIMSNGLELLYVPYLAGRRMIQIYHLQLNSAKTKK